MMASRRTAVASCAAQSAHGPAAISPVSRANLDHHGRAKLVDLRAEFRLPGGVAERQSESGGLGIGALEQRVRARPADPHVGGRGWPSHRTLQHGAVQIGLGLEVPLQDHPADAGSRYAREDVEIGGVTIRDGEAVLLDTTLANFDDTAFGVTRAPNPHVAFAHGPWRILSATLARIELRTVFVSLLPRLPALRPAVPVEELRLSADSFTSTLVELPVTW
ncbi:hypothetical protein AB0L13_27685 [Saccharopolyspora shandongensis]|uniref:hypothetical protein n=1 Tax=Saccharopolyspora shandongensis TaxID=418495 RepID=UPI0034475726